MRRNMGANRNMGLEKYFLLRICFSALYSPQIYIYIQIAIVITLSEVNSIAKSNWSICRNKSLYVFRYISGCDVG